MDKTHAPKINMGRGWANRTRDRGAPSRNTSQKENGLRRVNHCIQVSNSCSEASDGQIHIEDTEPGMLECQGLKVFLSLSKTLGTCFNSVKSAIPSASGCHLQSSDFLVPRTALA